MIDVDIPENLDIYGRKTESIEEKIEEVTKDQFDTYLVCSYCTPSWSPNRYVDPKDVQYFGKQGPFALNSFQFIYRYRSYKNVGGGILTIVLVDIVPYYDIVCKGKSENQGHKPIHVTS